MRRRHWSREGNFPALFPCMHHGLTRINSVVPGRCDNMCLREANSRHTPSMPSHLRHLLFSLSLLAAILLASTPTLGRIAQVRQIPDASTLSSHFCGDAHAPTQRLLAMWLQEQALRKLLQAPHGDHQPDCEYCPLLASLVFVAIMLVAVLWMAPAATPRPPAIRSRRTDLHPCGLGSRGPPIAL